MSPDQNGIEHALKQAIHAALKYRKVEKSAEQSASLRHVPTPRVFKVRKALRKALERLPEGVLEKIDAHIKQHAFAPAIPGGTTRIDRLIKAGNLVESLEKALTWVRKDLR